MEIANQYLSSIQSVLTILAILVGGSWTYFKFVKRREAHPKIIFELDYNIVGKIKHKWVVELIAKIDNKGLVQHKIDANSFTFDIRYLKESDEIENQEITATSNKRFQLNFKNKLKLRNNNGDNLWLPDN